jgi:recombination protein RecA
MAKEPTKEQRLEAAIKVVEKAHGKFSLKRLGGEVGVEWPSIPTGIYGIDWDAIGCGGIPRRRITLVTGPTSGGKTTLTLQTVANCQRLGGTVAYIDAEFALDATYASALGVDMDSLLISQPEYGEQGFDIADILIKSGAVDLVVIDSVAMMTPKVDIEGEMEKGGYDVLAKLIKRAVGKYVRTIEHSNCALLMINQLRTNLDQTGPYSPKDKDGPGGQALYFGASVYLDVRKIGRIKDGEEIIGAETKVYCRKNRMTGCVRPTFVNQYIGRGFSAHDSLFRYGVDNKLIEKEGSYYSYADARFQGKDTFIAELPVEYWQTLEANLHALRRQQIEEKRANAAEAGAAN